MLKDLKLKEIKRFFALIKPRTVPFMVGLLGRCFIDASVSIVFAYVLKDLINGAINGDMSLLMKAVFMTLALTVIICTLYPVLYYMHASCVKKTMADVRLKAFYHIEELPLNYYTKTHSGDVISRLTNDVQTFEKAYLEQLKMIVFTLMFGIGSMIFMMIFDWRIASILIVFGVVSAFINSHFAIPIRKISDRIQEKTGFLTERLVDLLSGFSIMKMFHIEDIIIGKFSKVNKDVTKESISRTYKNALLESTNFLLIWINFGGVMAVGAFMVLNGTSSFGKLVAIVQLLNGMVFMFLQLGQFISQLQGSLAGASRVFELLEVSKEADSLDIKGVKDSQAVVELSKVVFKYEEGNSILKELSLKVEKSQVAALVGPSGGGKSTVVKLLLGFYPIESGGITINGKPYGQYTLAQLRELMAYVPQDAYLFDGTIEENIRQGRQNATTEEITAAAIAANAHNFILEQPEGYNTVVGERGARLSGGQKQRIAIARAILKDSPILLLDEATSALDSESEQLVQEALNVLMKNRTVIVIAHRLSTIEHADIIYVIDNGRVEEQGKHENLTLNGGTYNRLYDLQFKQELVG